MSISGDREPSNDGPAETLESESNGQRASRAVRRDHGINKRWQRLQTVSPKLHGFLRHKQLGLLSSHAEEQLRLFSLRFSHHERASCVPIQAKPTDAQR